MAKQISNIQVSGKLGANVGMTGENGENYMRMNAKPSNPKTTKQVAVRTKMVLAGKMSKLTPANFIDGLSASSKRQRRSRFVKNIINNTIDDRGVMYLDPEKLVLSEGRYVELPDATVTYANGVLTTAVTALPADMAALEVVAYFGKDGEYVAANMGIIKEGQLSVSMGFKDGDFAQVYFIPVVRAEGASSVAYSQAVEALAAQSDAYSADATISETDALTRGASQYDQDITNTVTP